MVVHTCDPGLTLKERAVEVLEKNKLHAQGAHEQREGTHKAITFCKEIALEPKLS